MAGLRRVLVLNAGSSSLKWTVLDAADGATLASGSEPAGADLGAVLARAGDFDAAGHRVVHGGPLFREATLVDEGVRRELESLVELDPLHMRPALAGIDAVRAAATAVPQVAAFDTAFHATLSEAAAAYALPREWTERWGLRRYGFHGLGVAHAVARAGEMLGRLPSRLVVCHLGSGCSVTAVRDGRSADTTMGFTPLEGVVMATRAGSVDPGLLLHLERRHGLGPEEIAEALTRRSGLLGVSGVSADLREVLAAADAGSVRAALAYDVFVLSLRRAVGAMTAVLGGLDALVFTGGIGEHQPRVRADVASALGFAGLEVDPEANRAARPDADVARPGSRVRLLVVAAREDLVVLREVARVLGGPGGKADAASGRS